MCVWGRPCMEAETISRVSPYLLQGLLLTTAYCKQAGPQFLRILISASYLAIQVLELLRHYRVRLQVGTEFLRAGLHICMSSASVSKPSPSWLLIFEMECQGTA